MTGELTYEGHTLNRLDWLVACAKRMNRQRVRMFGVKFGILSLFAIVALCFVEYKHIGDSEWAWGGGAFLAKMLELAGEAVAEVTE